MTTDIKTFQPITREEAERIVPDIDRGRISGANARDAAFFIYAHGRMNPGRVFKYTITGTPSQRFSYIFFIAARGVLMQP